MNGMYDVVSGHHTSGYCYEIINFIDLYVIFFFKIYFNFKVVNCPIGTQT